MLREVDVGVDEAREHEMAAPVDHALGRPRRLHVRGAADLDDALAVDQHGAVHEDPARGIHADDDGVLDEDHGRSPGEYDTRLRQEVLR